MIDCHAANGRLQDVRRAPRPRREPCRRDEEVEDVGARGEAGGADLCDDGVAQAMAWLLRATELVEFHTAPTSSLPKVSS